MPPVAEYHNDQVHAVPHIASRVFVLIVSKYSQSCSSIFKTVKFLAPHLNMKVLEIDHPKVRELIVSSNKIRTVPCIALVYPQENKVDFYEGNAALQLLQVEVDRVQKKIQQMVPPKTTDIGKVMDMPPSQPSHPQETHREQMPYTEDPRATLQGRNVVPQMPMEVPGHEQMASSSVPTATRRMIEPKNPLPPAPTKVKESSDNNNNRQAMFPDSFPSDMGASVDPDLRRPQQDPTGLPSDLPGVILDETSMYQFEMPEEQDIGMSRQDILGDQAGMSRELDKKSKQNRARMEEILRQRDEMDKMYVDPKDPRQRLPH